MQSEQTETFSLTELARSFAAEVAGTVERKKKNVFSTPGLNVFLLYIGAQGHVPTHHTAGSISVQTLIGRAQFTAEGTTHDLSVGRIIALAPGVPHELSANDESVLLVTHAVGAE